MADRRPIRLVLTEDRDLSAVPPGPAPRKVFKPVDDMFRKSLAGDLDAIEQRFASQLTTQNLPVVATATLEGNALAKSHRPDTLFSSRTCPIIGSDALGSLRLSVTNEGLRSLRRQVLQGSSQNIEADLSTLIEIRPFQPPVVPTSKTQLANLDKRGRPFKLKIFNHHDSFKNDRITRSLFELLDRDAEVEQLVYSSEMIVYRIAEPTEEVIEKLQSFVGTQSLMPLPTFSLTAQYLTVGVTSDQSFPLPIDGEDYPVVGLIDSGTDPSDSRLQSWVVTRDEADVPRSDQNNDHGSFIAGLIANGRALNGSDEFPDVQAKIVDVVAVPGSSNLYEDELLRIIRRVVQQYAYVKVWSLSLASDQTPCLDNQVSDFAIALDKIQQDHDVLFVNCAGNVRTAPLRSWPTVPASEADRIVAPADSVRALTVGSIAHKANKRTLSQPGEPSPFSRRGPGVAFMPKPEVCHYGGNCDASFSYAQTGVVSTTGGGRMVESIGTSFSTPLVAAIAAGTLSATKGDALSINMAKALIVHSAALRSRKTTAAELRYKGFGVPGPLRELFECEPHRATLLFEPEIPSKRRIFSKLDFPIPDCFRTNDGKLRGGFMLTAVYDPPLSEEGGYDYCRANVEVSLGSYDPTNPGADPAHSKLVSFHPKDYSKLGEQSLIEQGFKWSPVKVFQDEFRGRAADRMRLMVRLYLRDKKSDAVTQNVAIIATLYDPGKTLPVYDQTIQVLKATGWQTVPIELRQDVRERIR
jgi:serine protease AprX